MSGPISDYTPNYKFSLISYDFPRWQSYEHDNWRNLDATLGALFGSFGISGIWKNNITYNVNERVIDDYNNTMYLCMVNHTSVTAGSFAQDREAHPSYWRSLSFRPASRGDWKPNIQYSVQDIVSYQSRMAICTVAHLSSSSFDNDVNAGYWSVIIDVTGYNVALALTKANNLGDIPDTAAARSNLDLGTASERNEDWFFVAQNNLEEGDPATMRKNLQLGTSATRNIDDFLSAASNLSDLPNPATARARLGLGSLATSSAVSTDQITGAGLTGKALIKATNGSDAANQIATFGGDTGNGGSKGLVPAPAKGDGTAHRFLRADGGWVTPDYPVQAASIPSFDKVSGCRIVASNTNINIQVTSALLVNSAGPNGQSIAARGSYDINPTTVGQGGIQSGVTPLVQGFYPVYLIGNGTTISGYIAQNNDGFSVPTLPQGYTYYVRVGWVSTKSDGTIYSSIQYNDIFCYAEATPPVVVGNKGGIANGVATLGAVDLGPIIPPRVATVRGMMVKLDANATMYLSNIASFNNPQSNTPPPYALDPPSSGKSTTAAFDLVNINNTLYMVNSDGNGKLFVTGWKDTL